MMKNQIKLNGLNSYLRNPRGFTLIEIILAIILLGIMGIFSTQFITSITQSAQQTTSQKGLVDDAKLAMEYILREVRVASENNTDITYSSSATATTITFDKFNGYTVDTNATAINYSWNSTTKTLTRTSGLTTTTLATQVASFTIAESPAVDSDFYVFTLTLQGSNGENFTLQSGVRPRSTTI
jgi:prepilin-type N-terminal cleavage/methylation domain-containing protein